MMETRAIAKYIRVTPRKARLVVDLIRGKKVADALSILKFLPQYSAAPVRKLLYSAIANAVKKEVKDVEDMTISRAFVDQGPTLKRFMPRAMGRANIIRKRTSHITLYLSDQKGE